jgi:hypothetical protein
MTDAKTKKAIREAVSADKIVFKQDGKIVFKREYFYRCGNTADKFGNGVTAALAKIGLTVAKIETEDAWRPWPQSSYFVATITLGPSEKLLLGPVVCQYRGDTPTEIPSELYWAAVLVKKPGDLLVSFAGAPGTGRVIEKITRIDATGVYGFEVENSMRELSPSEVY